MAGQSLYYFTVSCVLKTKFTISAKHEERSLKITFDSKDDHLIRVSAIWGFASHANFRSLIKEDSIRIFDFLKGIKSYV